MAVLVLSLLAAVTGPASAATRRPAPLKSPVISVKLLTKDPVTVLQSGRFAVRVRGEEVDDYVGFIAATPQRLAGMRIEPPVSLPSEPYDRPAATAAADPPLEPPETRSASQGFLTGP